MKISHVTFAFLAGISSSLQAQTINSHHFRFGDTLETPMMEDALGENSELIRSEKKILLKASYDFANDLVTGTTSSSAINFPFVNDLQTFSLGISALLAPRVLIGVDVPLHYIRLSGAYSAGRLDPTAIRFGDISLHSKVRLTNDHAKINFALRPQLTIPTGNDAYFISEDSYGLGAQALLDTSVRRWKFFANAGIKYASRAEFLSINRKTTLGYGLGAFYEINSRFGLNGEWIHSISASNPSTGQNPTQMNLGLRYSMGMAKLFIGGGIHRFKFSGNNHPLSLYAGIKLPLGIKKSTVEALPTEAQAPAATTSPASQSTNEFDTLSNAVIYFDKNTYAVKKEDKGTLSEIAQQLISLKDQFEHVLLVGHSDPRGDEIYNQLLSEKRAMSIKKYLVQQGVDQQTLLTSGNGESGSTSTDENGYRIDRRVEFKVIRK